MFIKKKITPNACIFSQTLAYLSFKCGVVVELVTTLACHAGGRGFKSPPSRHLFKTSFFLFISFLFQVQSFSLQEQPSTQAQHESMKIIAADDPVYSFIQQGSDKYHFNSENKSRFTGGDIEIIRKILDNLKIPYEFQIVPFYKIESMLIHGEADLALGVVKTKKSVEYADFPKTPMRTQNYVFFGRKKDSKGPTMSFETILMHNFNVGISAYVRYPENFWKMFPYEGKVLNNHLVEYNSYEKSIADLKSKKIDVFIGNKDLVNSILARTKNTDIIFQYKNIL